MRRRICRAGLILGGFLVTGALWAEDRLSALGIGVSDLQASTAFYTDVLQLDVLRTYELGYLNEVVLGYADSSGAVLVLMHWPDQQREYDGNDVKLVFDVDDPAAVLERIRSRGGQVDMEAGPVEAVPGAIIGFGRDPDDYVIELIKR
jgi:lactoylglutathione lyase